MIRTLTRVWRRAFPMRDKAADAIKRQIADARSRHAPCDHLHRALRDYRHAQLRGAVK